MLPIKAEASWPGKDTAAKKYTHPAVTLPRLRAIYVQVCRVCCQRAQVHPARGCKNCETVTLCNVCGALQEFQVGHEARAGSFDFVKAEPADELTAQERASLLKQKKNEKYQLVKEHVMYGVLLRSHAEAHSAETGGCEARS